MVQQSGSEDLNDLGYVSSAEDYVNLAPATQTNTQDEADLPTLTVLSRLLANRLDYYRSVDSISLSDITVENQLIVNKKVVFHLTELQGLVDKTIERVKEKLNEQR